MSDKCEELNTNPGVVPRNIIKENNKESVQKASKIPRLFSTLGPLKQDGSISRIPEPVVAPKSNNATVTTVNNAPKETQTMTRPLKTTKVPVTKNINYIQKKFEPKLDFSHGDAQKSMLQRTSSMLKPNRATLNYLSTRSKTSLGFPSTQTCRALNPRPLKPQQVRNGGDEIRLIASERSQLQSFLYAKEKLKEMQSNFMEKCENLKDIKTKKIRGSYKFVSLVQNENCKLIVNNNDLVRLPKNLPSESVNDFREIVKEAFYSSLKMLENYFLNHKTPENVMHWYLERESLRNELKRHQEKTFKELSTHIDVLCKHPPDNQKELTRAFDELKETKCKLEELKMKTERERLELIAQHEIELAREIKNSEECEKRLLIAHKETVALGKKDEEIELNMKKIQELLQEIEELKNTIKELKNDKKQIMDYETTLEDQVARNNNKMKELLREIEELKICTKEVAQEKKLMEEKSMALEDKITELKQELENYQKHINQLQSKTEERSQTASASSSEIHEIELLKHKLDETQQVLLPLQEQNSLYKDLLEIRSNKIKTLETQETELCAQLENLKFENSQKNAHIAEMTMEKNSRTEDIHRLMDPLFEKEKHFYKLQHTVKLNEERIERNLKIQEQLKQVNAEQKAEIVKLKMRLAFNKVLERLRFMESSDVSDL